MSRSKLGDFEILSRLGAGSFGVVYKVRRLVDNQFYVIKNVRIAELSYKEQTEAINEVQILAQLKSPYVVRYFDSFIEKDSLHIVMEFCNRGDLQNLLKKAKEKNVPGLKDNVIWNITLQVMLGLYYLHKKHILHRDLKTANVFLLKDPSQENYLVKIGDLGVAKLMDTSTALANTIVGTPYYLSPELCKDLPYRDKSDCWALGVIIYECLTLQRPFDARNQCALILKIIEAEPIPPTNLAMISNSLWNLSIWLLQKDPNKRPSVKDLLSETVIRDRCAGLRFSLPEEVSNNDITYFLKEDGDSTPLHGAASSSNTNNQPTTTQTLQTQPHTQTLKRDLDYAQEKSIPSTSTAPIIEVVPTQNNINQSSGNANVPPALSKPPSIRAVTKTPSQRSNSTSEAKLKVRGDRVRGNNRRVPSEKALNRYQLKPPPKTSTVDYNADRKASDNRLTGAGLSSSKDLGYLDSPSHKDGDEDVMEDVGDIDEVNEVDQYEPDFEEDDDNYDRDDDEEGGDGRRDEKSVHLTDEEVRDSEENLISPMDDVAQPYTYQRDSEGEARRDHNSDNGNLHRANSIVTNHGEHDVESWKELILEGKRKAFYDLGEDLYLKVYDLCDFHMKENVEEGQGNTKLVTELEALIRREQYTNFELACEAAFRIKMLLVLESRYGKIEDHEGRGFEDEKTLRMSRK